MSPRQSKRPPINFKQLEILSLLEESAAGIALSGDSGSGKSNAMLVMLQAMMRHEIDVTLIDPHGDLAQDFERSCAALPRRLRDRVHVIRPSDLSHLVAINPLFVPYNGDWLRWRARLTAKVGQVARTLLYAWGERDFNSKPVLFKWLTRVLTTLATAGLTIPDARHFFQVDGAVYQALANAAPDELARMEMYELIDMRPREREDLIASTKNRLLGFLENPVVELVLGRPSNWLNISTLKRDGGVTIISLERAGVLREEDQEILANLWLCEVLDAVYNTPRAERRPHVVCIDELPVFGSSFDTIARAAGQVRKFLTRFVVAFQGTQLFPERTEDRLLNALISQCRTTVVFRHKNSVDAKFFGELVTLPVLDPLIEKHRLTQLQQYQDGNDVVFLTDEAESWNDAEQSGGSQSDASSTTATDTSTDSQSSGTAANESESRQEDLLTTAVGRARSEQAGTSRSRATGTGSTSTDGRSWSNTSTRGGSRTRKMTLVPRLRWREIVTSIQFFTPDEQVAFGARDVARLPTGEAVVYTAGRPPMRVRYPLAQGPLDRTPKFAAKKVRLLRQEIVSRPMFAAPAQIVSERREFERRLVAHLEQVAAEPQTIDVPQAATPTVPNPLLSI